MILLRYTKGFYTEILDLREWMFAVGLGSYPCERLIWGYEPLDYTKLVIMRIASVAFNFSDDAKQFCFGVDWWGGN